MKVLIPIRTVSETNMREHWAPRAKRRRAQRQTTLMVLRAKFARPTGLVRVALVRVAPRPLDSHDNLHSSLKSVVDGVADWLGCRDDNARISWAYDQRRGGVREYAVEITIEPHEAP